MHLRHRGDVRSLGYRACVAMPRHLFSGHCFLLFLCAVLFIHLPTTNTRITSYMHSRTCAALNAVIAYYTVDDKKTPLVPMAHSCFPCLNSIKKYLPPCPSNAFGRPCSRVQLLYRQGSGEVCLPREGTTQVQAFKV